ncbi:1-aminocyclopropane-1-carboxylate deaminase [Fluviispira sanaruensis]|uniref:1-aminocyclopropane-1-carboxylate deaminase n=1 Tax=Fluviispira sanaruensis TaxID=2493639 RepID=A0A4P2VK06_FLUSA|nr:1-aminocyclopropane-1-carboxylate deaminase [Fluviispira sanaruensis]BBH52224.1 1-aminocyclopropane-1-carboxylate deaminase [Fluviispira sanaruensis]
MKNYEIIVNYLNSFPMMNYPKTSRIHKLRSIQNKESGIFVKREDELGFGVSGTKIRKYLSLIPFLKNQNFQEVIVWGGAFSNNVLSAVQLLIESGIKPILFFDAKNKNQLIGNYLLTSLFLEKNSIHWLDKEVLNNKDCVINTYKENQLKKGIHVGYIEEGANMYEAFPGACSLALDILRNEKENLIDFNDIFIDAGTGLSAIALIICLSFLNVNKKIHIILVAGNEKEFNKSLSLFKNNFEIEIKNKIEFLIPYDFYYPSTAKSFGSINNNIFNIIKMTAQLDGIITDPIYSAKLFNTSKNIIKNNNLSGNILLIHSGGSLSLFGFSEKLRKLI